MDFNSGVSMILPDIENVYDEDDIVHEQTNQNEIVELIMAAFEGQDELSDEDDESLNTSDSSHESSDQTQILNVNNNNKNKNNTNEQYVQQQSEFIHQQSHFPSSKISTSPTSVPFNDLHVFQLCESDENLSFNYPTTSPTAFHFVPDSIENQYIYQNSSNSFHETQNQLNKLRILCSVKDRKACQLQNLCEEFREKYENDTQALQHQLELSEKLKYDYEQNYQLLSVKYDQIVQTNHQLYRTIEDVEKMKTQLFESNKSFQDQIQELTRSKEDYEILLNSIKEKHEQEIVSSNDKFENSLINLQEKTIQFDELQQTLTNLTKDKTQLEIEYQDLQSEVRTLREHLNEYEIQIHNQTEQLNNRDSLELSTIDQSIINENLVLKERINEYIIEQSQLRHFNEELNKKIQDFQYQSKRSDSLSSSTSSSSSNETVITTSVHMEQIKRLTSQIEHFKNDFSDLNEKFEYEKQELNTIIEQLREDVKDLDQTKQLYINVCQEKNLLEDTFQTKIDELYQRFEQDKQSIERKYQFEFESLKIKHEKQIMDLKTELDRLHVNNDVKHRLIYVENEFEQLKHDYYNLNTKYSDLLKTYSTLEQQNENLRQSIEQIQHDKSSLIQTYENEIVHLNEQNQSLQIRFNHLDNLIKQYEDYRTNIENNLEKILEQRDMHKQELQITKELLNKKENDFNQLKIHFQQNENCLQIVQEQFKQSQLENQQINEQFQILCRDKNQIEQRFNEVNHTLDLADSHLKQEIEKIKTSLEQEYQRRYQREHKHDVSNASEIEDLKKLYRTEIDRLYHEHRKLSQHQTKLNEAHQKQMQILKKDLENGYMNVIEELEREQTHLQTRYDQLKKQLNDAEQTIEQLKTSHQNEISRIKDSIEYENRNQKDNLQNRLENLVKLLEQSNNALNQERAMHTKQKQEYQQTIESLQKQLTINTQPMSTSTLPPTNHLGTMDKLRELFTHETIALLRLTCQMIFDVHHRVTVAHYMENLDIEMRKQIRNELIRSRNSMIKEIRREIFDKMTQALKSQGVPDISIDMQIFELDHLLSQIVQDCLNSLPLLSSSINSSTLSLQISPQPRRYQANTSKSSASSQKSIECLYMTPMVNKKPAPIAPHCRSSLDLTRRPKSASHVVLINPKSPCSPKYIHRSENDLSIAMEEIEDENDTTLTAQNDETTSSNLHYGTTKILHHHQQNNDHEEELSWPQEPLIPSSSPSHGIKKFVRNSLKLFITQPHQQKKSSK